MAQRLDPKKRRAEMLECALFVAASVGWRRMTRADIAAQCETSDALVTARLGVMEVVRKKVMREAVKRGLAGIVAQGLAEHNPIAMKASDEVKAAARRAL